MIRFIVVGLLVTVAGGAAAYDDAAGYKCNIKHSLRLAKDGSLGPHELEDHYHKMEFVIDRASGRMLGGTAGTPWKYEVLDRGSDKQSYVAVYTSQPGPFFNIQLLQIKEWEDGTRQTIPACRRHHPSTHRNLHPSPVKLASRI